ncbi:MAG TPA: hypothetical protein VFZ65_06005 [Planctomycetota bacterium]|nr:hypothetical protein [Planctomycetota bacterium]
MSSPGGSPRARPVVEVGVLIAHAVDAAVLRTIDRARERVRAELARALPTFRFRMPLRRWYNPVPGAVACTTRLLLQGSQEREQRRWDFAIVATSSDLQTFLRPDASAAPSRAVATAVVSTARLMPDAPEPGSRSDRAAQRLASLCLHVIADLNGVPHAGDPRSYSSALQSTADLDRMELFGEQETAALAAALANVADARLEETSAAAARTLPFYLQVLHLSWREIAVGVAEARPWLFPFRLARLTTAAVAATLLLMFTQEMWRLGLAQPAGRVAIVCVLALALATGSVLSRQHLLLRRGRRRLTEQSAVMNVTVTLVVAGGVFVTFVGVLATALIAGLLFDAKLIGAWVPGRELDLAARIQFAAYVGALGIVVGGLGAAFEGDDYLRHVIYVDEEV